MSVTRFPFQLIDAQRGALVSSDLLPGDEPGLREAEHRLRTTPAATPLPTLPSPALPTVSGPQSFGQDRGPAPAPPHIPLAGHQPLPCLLCLTVQGHHWVLCSPLSLERCAMEGWWPERPAKKAKVTVSWVFPSSGPSAWVQI